MKIRKLLTTLALAGLAPVAALASAPNPHAPAALGAPASAAALPSAKKAKPPATGQHQLVDLNAASREELMKLPGIGKAEADRIIAHRPYQVKTDLVNKKVLPTGPYLALRKQVVALPHGPLPKPAKAAKTAKTASAARSPQS